MKLEKKLDFAKEANKRLAYNTGKQICEEHAGTDFDVDESNNYLSDYQVEWRDLTGSLGYCGMDRSNLETFSGGMGAFSQLQRWGACGVAYYRLNAYDLYELIASLAPYIDPIGSPDAQYQAQLWEALNEVGAVEAIAEDRLGLQLEDRRNEDKLEVPAEVTTRLWDLFARYQAPYELSFEEMRKAEWDEETETLREGDDLASWLEDEALDD